MLFHLDGKRCQRRCLLSAAVRTARGNGMIGRRYLFRGGRYRLALAVIEVTAGDAVARRWLFEEMLFSSEALFCQPVTASERRMLFICDDSAFAVVVLARGETVSSVTGGVAFGSDDNDRRWWHLLDGDVCLGGEAASEFLPAMVGPSGEIVSLVAAVAVMPLLGDPNSDGCFEQRTLAYDRRCRLELPAAAGWHPDALATMGVLRRRCPRMRTRRIRRIKEPFVLAVRSLDSFFPLSSLPSR